MQTIDKSALYEYVDACKVVEEADADLCRLLRRQQASLQDCVKGSNPNFPYEPRTFHIEGVAENISSDEIKRYRKILMERRQQAHAKRIEVEAWVNTIPLRMQRIVRLKFFEGLTWSEVGLRMNGRGSGESARKEFTRFMKGE